MPQEQFGIQHILRLPRVVLKPRICSYPGSSQTQQTLSLQMWRGKPCCRKNGLSQRCQKTRDFGERDFIYSYK